MKYPFNFNNKKYIKEKFDFNSTDEPDENITNEDFVETLNTQGLINYLKKFYDNIELIKNYNYYTFKINDKVYEGFRLYINDMLIDLEMYNARFHAIHDQNSIKLSNYIIEYYSNMNIKIRKLIIIEQARWSLPTSLFLFFNSAKSITNFLQNLPIIESGDNEIILSFGYYINTYKEFEDVYDLILNNVIGNYTLGAVIPFNGNISKLGGINYVGALEFISKYNLEGEDPVEYLQSKHIRLMSPEKIKRKYLEIGTPNFNAGMDEAATPSSKFGHLMLYFISMPTRFFPVTNFSNIYDNFAEIFPKKLGQADCCYIIKKMLLMNASIKDISAMYLYISNILKTQNLIK